MPTLKLPLTGAHRQGARVRINSDRHPDVKPGSVGRVHLHRWDNSKNQREYLIKFDGRIDTKDYAELDLEPVL